jgi:hypothetical protein
LIPEGFKNTTFYTEGLESLQLISHVKQGFQARISGVDVLVGNRADPFIIVRSEYKKRIEEALLSHRNDIDIKVSYGAILNRLGLFLPDKSFIFINIDCKESGKSVSFWWELNPNALTWFYLLQQYGNLVVLAAGKEDVKRNGLTMSQSFVKRTIAAALTLPVKAPGSSLPKVLKTISDAAEAEKNDSNRSKNRNN